MDIKDKKKLLGLEFNFYGDSDKLPLVGIMFDVSCRCYIYNHPDGNVEFIIKGMSDKAFSDALMFFRLENESKSKAHISTKGTPFEGRVFDVFHKGEVLIRNANLARTLRGEPVIPYETSRSEKLISITASSKNNIF